MGVPELSGGEADGEMKPATLRIILPDPKLKHAIGLLPGKRPQRARRGHEASRSDWADYLPRQPRRSVYLYEHKFGAREGQMPPGHLRSLKSTPFHFPVRDATGKIRTP